MVCSYAPTLASIANARRGWETLPLTNLSTTLAYEPSSGPMHLPNVANEVRVVAKECMEPANVKVTHDWRSPMDALTAVRHLESGASILHLACHGIQEPNPLDSCFILRDGRLTINTLMDLELPRAALAFLSACETAKGDSEHPDEAVHLAASMLFCGFRSVIATMWSVATVYVTVMLG
jgi:CHAT domain-containing protein